ncbi:hypothetical protein N7462_006619 [Penicillium macrosclerotiorum]|uniref:uncharacterized protein n=1 Tax=Penicillium macrosclerotiorum TaxID=303699 RepID=UPI0025492283|nr:uncharacterized protein N7462_006619 [Penicillium macrosclerotiorum]KAJ5683454.1 hypothetical protein N7462_006619 [Penicillium macrosclerotiorum]
MLLIYSLCLLSTAFGLLCSSQPLNARGVDSKFSIYAFGDNISGLQVYYADVTVSSSAEYTWLAHADSKNASWSTKILYMADGGSSEVGFTASSTTGKLTNVWWTYGRYVLVKVDGASFYAEPVQGVSGDYLLSWSDSDESSTDKILVTLRTIEASTESVLN